MSDDPRVAEAVDAMLDVSFGDVRWRGDKHAGWVPEQREIASVPLEIALQDAFPDPAREG